MSALLAAGGIGQVAAFAGRLAGDVAAVAGSIAVLFIAVNGIRWAASNGSPHRQAEARAGLVAAGIGLAVTLSAGLIAGLVTGALR
ncbi:MAG TPA: hypothetical protein VNG13_03275 [Mycobacteriales bacterium]|nr:hypothetical protein [Mycobacteriales bacterium]